jgi:hypothetical protein
MNLHLSEWLPWELREQLPDGPGVYLIAEGVPGRTVYIGKTWGEFGLRGRVRAFHRSASTGLKGHAGGLTYNQRRGAPLDDLFVAVHVPTVVRSDPEVLYPYIHYVERRLIWEFVVRVGRMPVCNTD